MQKKSSFIRKVTAFVLAGIMAATPAVPAAPVLADDAATVVAETAELKVTTTTGGSVMVSAENAVITVKADENGSCTANGATDAVAARVENGAAIVTAKKGVPVTVKAVPESTFECAFFAVSTDTGDELNNAQAGAYVTVLDTNKKVTAQFTKVEVPVETASAETADTAEEPVADEAAETAEEAEASDKAEEAPVEEVPAPEEEPAQEEKTESEPSQEETSETTETSEEADEPSKEEAPAENVPDAESESITEDTTESNTDDKAEPEKEDKAETSKAEESKTTEEETPEEETPEETTAEDDRAAVEAELRAVLAMLAAEKAAYGSEDIPMDVAGAPNENVTIMKGSLITDGFNSYQFSTTNGATYNAFCLEPWKTAPTGSATAVDGRNAFSAWAHKELRKLLYYSPDGPGYQSSAAYWAEIDNYYNTYHHAASLKQQRYAAIHLAASLVYATEQNLADQWASLLAQNGIVAGHGTRARNLQAAISKLADPPATFAIYKIESSGMQDLVLWRYTEVGSFQLTKKSNIVSTTSLKGAVYTVYTDKALKNVYGTLTTNAKGTATLKNVPVGTYYIKETTAPKNFDLDKTTYTVKVEANKTAKVTSTENEHCGQFQIEKTIKNNTGNALTGQGAVFTMYTDENCTKAFATLTIGKSGKSNIVKNIPYGKYYVKETTAPPYCMLDETVHSVTINASDSGEVNGIEFRTYTDEAYGGIRIRKVNAETGKTDPALAGTKFEIYNLTGATITVNGKKYKNNAKIMDAKVDKTGIWESGIHDFPHGKYGIKEVSTTSTYILLSEMQEVTVKNGLTYVEKKIGNTPKRGDISFHKQAKETEVELPNVAFRIALLDDENNEVEWHIIVTNEHGDATTKSDPSSVAHSDNTNKNDEACGKDEDGKWIVVDESKLSPNYGIWFSGSATSTVAPDDEKGALPAGRYRLTELPSSANANFKMLNDDEGIIFVVEENMQVKDLGILENEAIWAPAITTLAKNPANGSQNVSHFAVTGPATQLVDVITYTQFNEPKTYTVVSRIYDVTDKMLLKNADGSTFEVRTPLVIEEGKMEGTFEVPVTINTEGMEGHVLVFREYVFDEDKVLASHTNDSDVNQTIYFPHIGTQASDAETGSKFIDSSKPVVITDTVSYEGLQPGLAYTLNGTLMDKATGKALMDDAGKAITASMSFTPRAASGTVELEFKFNGKTLIGKTGVAFETVKLGDADIAIHADINDEAQTVYFPSISTTLTTADGEKDAMASGTVAASDTISYSGLEPGSYVAVGTLMDQDTEEAVTGEVEKAFTVEDVNGTVTVDFDINADELAGKTVVAFEKVYTVKDGTRTLVASHEDIDDEAQSLYFPQVGTELLDETTKEHIALADEETVFVDHVFYSNVIVGKEYTASGVLVDKETREPVLVGGEQVKASKTFVPTEKSGYVDIEFRFSSAALAGKTIVAFEDLFRDDRKVAAHADLTDSDQTVYIPRVSTSLTGKKTGEHLAKAEAKTVIEDAVAYENIIPGRTYVMKSTLMDKATGRTVSVSGAEAETKFTAEEASATVIVSFEIDARSLVGKAVVCYEKLYIVDEGAEENEELTDDDMSEVAAHEDLSDPEQTVFLPAVETELLEKDSAAHVALPMTEVTLVDTVSYKGLIPGKSYSAKGTLMNKATNDPLLVDGKEVTAEAEFTPEKTDGTVELTFTFKAVDLAGQSVVAFEHVYLEGVEVAVHADINDKDQTVEFPEVRLATVLTNDATGSHEALAEDGLTFTDTVSYENVLVGAPLTLKGVLMDKETGEKLLIDGKEVTGEVTFTPASSKGNVKVPFALNGKGLEGKTLVAFERLYDKDGMVIAFHENINDPAQAVDLPEVETELKDSETGEHETLATETVVLTDRVSFTNLKPGKSYTAKGILMDKATEKPLLVNGKEVTAEAAFTPTEPNGVVELTFTFNGIPVAGKSVVAFEHVYDEKGNEVAVHADIEDEDQTVDIPKIRTELKDTVTDSHEAKADETITLVDRVTFTNVQPGKKYTAKGILMDKATEKPLLVDGKELTAEAEFTPDEPNGTVELTFTFKGLDVKGKSIVAFEHLYNEKGTEVAVHADIEDKDQTVDVPEIDTELKDSVTGEHETLARENVVLVDVVSFKGLKPGKTYKSTGVLMDKATEKPLLVDGKEVTAEAEFTPDEPDGTVELTFTFNGIPVAGKSVVAFERVYNEKGHEVAVHADIEDEDQTVDIPKIRTELKDTVTDSHEAKADETITLVDRVTYTNVQPGKNYTAKGVLMDKATEEPLLVDGKEVTAEAEFTPDEPNGTVELTFTFKGLDLAGKSVVAFEHLYNEKGIEVAVHADIEDKDQTVDIPEIDTELKDSVTGTHDALATENVVLIDQVTFKNMKPGKTYKAKGVLMDKATEKPLLVDGKEVTAEAEFTPDEPDGTVELTFTFNGIPVAGKSVVAFERVYNEGGLEVAVHTDLEDEDQTVNIPEIRTQLLNDKTGTHEAKAEEHMSLTDTMTFKGLTIGEKYLAKGILMDKATGEPVVVDGKELTAEAEFRPKETEGSAKVTFTFNGLTLAGKTIVAFETVYNEDGKVVGVHADINDEDQAVSIPSADTELTDEETGTHVTYAKKTVTLVDEVSFTNLVPNKKYTFKGVLMDKATGKELLVDGKTVTDEQEYTPQAPDGVVKLTFTFNGVPVAGKHVVAFERIYDEGGNEVAVHTDINDTDQTVDIPKISTVLTDKKSGTHTAKADEKITVIDKVAYEALPAGEYVMSGVLMDKKTGKPLMVNGKQVTATKKFTADGKDGSVELTFTFKGIDMAGKAVVAFETLYDAKGEVVADHKDITDPDQTVYIPELTTELTDKVTKTHTAEALESVTLVDEVEYSGLTPNKKYLLKGVLMDKATGKPLLVDGKQVTAEKSFTPKKSSGTEYISFTFNGIPVAGKHVVAFEYAYDEKGNEVAVHADINDDDQTVNIPKIVTELVNKATNGHTVSAAASVTLTDKVTYTALTPGETCYVKGVLMDKATGKPLMVNGKQVTAEKPFIVDASGNGSVELDFTFSASALSGKTLVAFEYVSNKDGKQIASHTAINDAKQTVTFPGTQRPPKTGDTAKGTIAFLVMLLGIAAVVIGVKRRRDIVK